MTIKTLLATAFLAVFPAMALACPAHQQQAMSCADGHMWDDEAGTCIPVVTG